MMTAAVIPARQELPICTLITNVAAMVLVGQAQQVCANLKTESTKLSTLFLTNVAKLSHSDGQHLGRLNVTYFEE
jgi:hypothetical protein